MNSPVTSGFPIILRSKRVLPQPLFVLFLAIVLIAPFFPGYSYSHTFKLKPQINTQIKKDEPVTPQNIAIKEELPDLTIRSVHVAPATPVIGSEANVAVTVYNLGLKEASRVTVRVSYQGNRHDQVIRLIDSQRSSTIEIPITILGPAGSQSVSVEINPGRPLKEKDYNNNSSRESFMVKDKPKLSIKKNRPAVQQTGPSMPVLQVPDIISFVPDTVAQGTSQILKGAKEKCRLRCHFRFRQQYITNRPSRIR